MVKFSNWRSKDEQEKRRTARGQYTTEFKLEAVRLVKDGQSASVTAKVLGYPLVIPFG